MAALLDGDDSALEAIMAKWERPLFSFSYRYTQNEHATRDIVQETFVRVFIKRDKYDFKYPLSSWIFTIAANLCKNKARWHRRHPELSIDAPIGDTGKGERTVVDTLPSDAALPSERVVEAEELDTLKRAVMALPHDLKTAVLLHHYENLSYKEIATTVGCSVRGVETRLYRARKALRIKVEKLRARDEENAQKKTLLKLSSSCAPAYVLQS